MASAIFKKPWPYLALMFAHIIWGGNFVVAKVTLQEFPPMTLALLRFALASLLLAPFFLAETKKVKVDKKDLPKLIAIGVLMITLNITFFLQGIGKTAVTDAAILTLVIPIFSVLLGWWFLKEKVYLINLLGVALGLLGALTVIGLPKIFAGSFSPQALLGNVLIILASLSWVLGATVSKTLLNKYSSLAVTAIAFLIGTITFFIPAAAEYIQNPAWVNSVTVLGLLGLAYMTLLSSISAYFLFEWGLAKTTLNTADLFQYIEPFVATALAIFILGEQVSKTFVLGALLIGAGVYLGTFAKEAHHRHQKAHRV